MKTDDDLFLEPAGCGSLYGRVTRSIEGDGDTLREWANREGD